MREGREKRMKRPEKKKRREGDNEVIPGSSTASVFFTFFLFSKCIKSGAFGLGGEFEKADT